MARNGGTGDPCVLGTGRANTSDGATKIGLGPRSGR